MLKNRELHFKLESALFKEYGWDVVGIGLKLTKELPDLDVFVIKDGLALAIQVKTTYGTGINTFEQWKSRAKILKGVDQASSIKLALNNKTLLNKWLTRKQAAKIRIVESVVITNSHIYNGWDFKGIPVVSFGSLMQIFRGANVKFTSTNGQVLSTKRYVEGDFTVEKFMDFVRFPLDWRLANETNIITYKKQESDYVIFKIPSISRMDGLTESDVIADGRPTIHE